MHRGSWKTIGVKGRERERSIKLDDGMVIVSPGNAGIIYGCANVADTGILLFDWVDQRLRANLRLPDGLCLKFV